MQDLSLHCNSRSYVCDGPLSCSTHGLTLCMDRNVGCGPGPFTDDVMPDSCSQGPDVYRPMSMPQFGKGHVLHPELPWYYNPMCQPGGMSVVPTHVCVEGSATYAKIVRGHTGTIDSTVSPPSTEPSMQIRHLRQEIEDLKKQIREITKERDEWHHKHVGLDSQRRTANRRNGEIISDLQECAAKLKPWLDGVKILNR